MICSKCGNEIPDNTAFCEKCGAETETSEQTLQPEQSEAPVTRDIIHAELMIISIFIPLVGIILGIVNLCYSKPRSGRAYLIAGCISGLINLSIAAAVYLPMWYEHRVVY